MILVITIPWYGKMLIALCEEFLQVCGNGFLVPYATIMFDIRHWGLEIVDLTHKTFPKLTFLLY
jgi:hypothetical protein